MEKLKIGAETRMASLRRENRLLREALNKINAKISNEFIDFFREYMDGPGGSADHDDDIEPFFYNLKMLCRDQIFHRLVEAAVGLLQLQHIDDFNNGARLNARILTEKLGNVPGVKAPRAIEGDHIYVYYPLTVAPERRDDLRHYLLKNGIDTKTTDMADCAYLKPFREEKAIEDRQYGPSEASILEICVYPVISQAKMLRIARIIRAWAAYQRKNKAI